MQAVRHSISSAPVRASSSRDNLARVQVAALYDVHGNLPALEAVLDEVEREGVDAIVSGGDLISGPFPAAVFDRLAALPQTWFVRGNADRLVVEEAHEEQDGLHAWCAAQLGEERLAAVATWPLTIDMEIDGLGRVLFCHAIPKSDEPIFTRITPEREVIELFGSIEADVVVCGHTHVQFDRRLENGVRIVNAGSVGMPYQGRRGAFWALLGPDVALRHTEYDVEAGLASVRAAGAPLDEQLTSMLLEPPDADEVTAYWESQRTGAK